MKRSLCIAGLATVLAMAACSKDKKDAGGNANKPQPVAPESVPILIQAELPSGRDLGRGNEVIDSFSPGASAAVAGELQGMLTELSKAPSLDGADLAKPVRMVVLDPKKHPEPVVLLVSVADAAKLTQSAGKERVAISDSLALIGSQTAIEAARAYMLATLAAQPAPELPRAVVYAQPILASFRAEIDGFTSQMSAMMAMVDSSGRAGKAMGMYVDALEAIFEQTDSIEITLANQSGYAGATMVLRPRKDTVFAQFNSVQKPSEFGLLGKLPATETQSVLMAGHMVAGPAREAFMKIGSEITALFLGGGVGEEMRAMLEPWMSLFTGEFAGVMPSLMGGMKMVQVFAVSDGAKSAEYSKKMMETISASKEGIEVMGMKQTITYKADAFVHEGVPVSEQHTKVDLDSVPEDQRAAMQAMGNADIKTYIAGFDSFMAMSMGSDTAMRALIDSLRGKGQALVPSATLGRALELAKTRKDSLMMAMDLGSMMGGMAPMPPGMPTALVMSVGFDGGNATLFVGAGK